MPQVVAEMTPADMTTQEDVAIARQQVAIAFTWNERAHEGEFFSSKTVSLASSRNY
jgi:hypothetical protein